MAPDRPGGTAARRGERLDGLAAATAGSTDLLPVLNEDYAERIARDWNVKASGVGHVTRFAVRRRFLDDFDVQQAGGRTILEYWIPAEQLDALNAEIVGRITLVSTFRRDDGDGEIRKLTAADEQAPGTADSADGRPTTEPGAPAPSRASAPR